MNTNIDPRNARLHDKIKVRQWNQVIEERMARAIIRDNQRGISYVITWPSNSGSTFPLTKYVPTHP